MKLLSLVFILAFCLQVRAQEKIPFKGPIEYIYDASKTVFLKAYVFQPIEPDNYEKNPAIVIFHGGGWSIGEASWAFELCEKYAKKGMVAVAAQYRLSDEKNITPIDAMEDARNIILWMRQNSEKLNINKDSIVAYGWSAGAHLAACAAVFPSSGPEEETSSSPNALILVSPALSMEKDSWFKKLLGERKDPLNYSPAEHLRENIPPSIIVVGKDDTVTPISQSILFHENMQKFGNESYLHIYEGVGHLFTPSSEPDNGWPNPDKAVQSKANNQIDSFLRKLGYIN